MNDYDQERRTKEPSRREGDTIDRSEIRLLRHEIQTMHDKLAELRSRVDTEEAQDHERIESLEADVAGLRNKLSGVKGVLYGIGLGFSALIYLIIDRLKELLIK